ncbi:MAG: ATP-binding protein [Nostocaceae cyanobacterium]|nr:ATP-binding protein [Nostocaceae cyanobacterium]
MNPTNPILDGLLPLLQRLDLLLEQAVAAAKVVYGTQATDLYQGLHIDAPEVERLLSRQPATPVFQIDRKSVADIVPEGSRLAWLQTTFELSAFDIDVLAITLAPELDRRYERLYAYLQDDVRCKRPSVDLALNLLCSTASAKLEQRQHFAPDAPLIRHNLLHLVSESHSSPATLLGHELHLDSQVIRFLLGESGLDKRLAAFCQLIQPTVSLDDVVLDSPVKKALSTLVVQDWQTEKSLALYFQGTDRTGKRRTAAALATEVGRGKTLLCPDLLVCDLARMIDAKTDFEPTLKLLCREAWFQGALLYLDNLEVLQTNEQSIAYQSLLAAITQQKGITILAGTHPWTGDLALVSVPFTIPDFKQRRHCWQTHLTAAGIPLDELDLDALADRFRLTADQIAHAVQTACNTSRWQAATQGNISPSPIVYAAARAQSGHELGKLARKIQPKYSIDDIVLPPEQRQQLQEICNQVKYQPIVYGEWGFERKLSVGKGLNVLFSGEPGTGKTMAAEIIAQQLQLDLYKIDLSQVVSKYIGETEKNLNRIFTAAEGANAILFFDEADALFGKRSEVKDAHDRYANLEIAYLLQKMEEYEGISILTSNFRQNLDDAFTRRIRFIVEFPFPEDEYRYAIWQGMFPKQTPLTPDVDLWFMAREFPLAGGNIRNIALAAAFLAAENGQAVGMKHLLLATKREFQKMGRLVSDEEFLQLEMAAGKK